MRKLAKLEHKMAQLESRLDQVHKFNDQQTTYDIRNIPSTGFGLYSPVAKVRPLAVVVNERLSELEKFVYDRFPKVWF